MEPGIFRLSIVGEHGTNTIAAAEVTGRSRGCGDGYPKCLLHQRYTPILFLSKADNDVVNFAVV